MFRSLLSLVPAVFTQSPDGLNYADPNLSQIASAAWDTVVTDRPVDQIFGALKLASAIQEGGGFVGKVSASGGKTFETTLEYATNPTARSYGELEAGDGSRVDTFSAATYQQKQHGVFVYLTAWEELRTQGDAAKWDYVAGKLKNAKQSSLSNLNDCLASDGSGQGGNDVDGLLKLIPLDPTTGVVGQIDPANFAWWRSQQASGAKTSTAGDNIKSSWTSVYDQCSRGGNEDEPTDVLTDRATFELFGAQIQALERYTKSGKKQQGANLGLDNSALMFKGAEVQYDEAIAKYSAASAFFINPTWLQFAYLTGGWMRLFPAVESGQQFAKTFKVLTIGQLISAQRRRLGVVSGCS
jgi:hypothetical protein